MAVRSSRRKTARRHAPKAARRPSASRRRHRKFGFLRRHWKWFAPPVAVVGLVVVALGVLYIQLPLPEDLPGPQTTFLYDRDGNLVTTLHAEVDRTAVHLDDMPDHLKEAVLAAEDAGFYSHAGVSLTGIIRAAWANLTNRRIEQGGSTITQQYVRNALGLGLGTERTFLRKVKEALLAVKLERKRSKDWILERYLNSVYFGHGAYGVEAAAKTYFGRRAQDLSLLQSATLAGVIAAPETFQPIKYPERAKDRRDYVLSRMAELRFITNRKALSLQDRPVRTAPASPGIESSPAAYFVDHTRRFLENHPDIGSEKTFAGGLRVRMTLDPDYQSAAEEAITTHLSEPGDPAVALVAIDPANGEIRAMVGGRDFRRAKFNLATQARRQTGSSFKTFTLVAAIEDGISLRSRFNGPGRITITDERCRGPSGLWQPANYSDSGAGTLDLVSATARSVNTIFAQLVTKVGPDKVVEVAHHMGIRSKLQPVCSITLGTQVVTPLEMTSAYATLAADGVRHAPVPVRWIRNADGDVVWRPDRRGRQVVEENDAAQATYALERVVQGGTGHAAYFGDPVAGKTGTTDDHADAWFCGYSRLLAACVWVGFPQGRVPMEPPRTSISVTGGSYPAMIWHDFMSSVHEGLETPDFIEPEFTGEFTGVPASPTPTPTPTTGDKGDEDEEEEPSPSPTPSPTPTEPLPTVPPTPSPNRATRSDGA